jgi:hypothetical protein
MGKPGRKPIGRLRFRRQDIIKVDVQERELGVWTALFWLRIGTSNGLL